MAATDMDKLVSLCKRRGFIFQSSEIYGGINGFWDYGPLGVELKKNIKEAWWTDMVRNPPIGPKGEEITMVGLDCSIIMNPRVWEASGHVSGFSDPMVDCKTEGCKSRFRADQIPGMACPLKPSKAPGQYEKCSLTEPRTFNLMFQTYVGALQDASSVAYLRPETAQGIFANFKNVVDSSRVKVPFGIAQIGKAFRNEINPRNYTFRSREFEQMEIEFFCHPDESRMWYEWWRDLRKSWYARMGISSDKLRPREQDEKELAFYSCGTTDIEYLFPFSDEPAELEGVAHRGAYDLGQHTKFSGQDLTYFDETAWERDKASHGTNSFKEFAKKPENAELLGKYQYLPHVIEPSAGADRFTLAVLCEAYTEDKVPNDKGGEEERLVLKIHPRLAPIKAAILPLMNKDGLPEKAMALYRELKAEFNVFYDDKGAIGRRYRRQDEAGTPFCITIDPESMTNDSVTIRDRDSLKQRRIPIREVANEIRAALRPTW
ncbi:glycine--tRNA ligase [Tuwongella immobilis]|uniref:Glycine--tRNA ligase n=1 Tax=Tuwongella immobilis TaxID=692036 RepID=A0A6C2YN32_9BACT|nr:glycine--tRNA ligase [Tuwongella immobilis]VIP02312.1 glycyl-trna synthetase subunit beta : Glycine--tRNA ligase OS=Gemmatimonadetes bacterium KBS708 GN=glyQS PE=3 SV=1: tRNA-synt_2b: HGTP_anticodon [Tuwongella immobilis]VTS01022.1 glycyl-trna synthetase subunit beta : Glycine--tRNA ligase OS=Gemmatimonadetes bacterium KBS708 GN=glyQS PE=3 SV=1: tRNA-synt_2b: HGTP_anticodon [Tuwongella immobilis]